MTTLYFDGQCPLCLREIRVLEKSKDGHLKLVDVHSYEPAPGEPSRESMLLRLHLKADDGRGLKEDFETRGRICLVFLALYLIGWIGVGIMFWIPELWHLALVNGLYALISLTIFRHTNARARTLLHLALIMVTIYGSFTVWTTPSLEIPWRNPVELG